MGGIQRPGQMTGSLVAITTAWLMAGCASARQGAAPPSEDGPERVHVGYATQDRDDLTTAVGSITADEIGGQRPVRIEDMIEGRFAGVQVIRLQNGGITLRIRGVSTLMGNTEPLYVIDGMPVDAPPGSALMGINPADVARIDILKDAGSTAIYGSRGANGVVLITTRRGR